MASILEGMAKERQVRKPADSVVENLPEQAKERMEEGRNQHSPVVNLPQDTDKTRDSIAAEIAKAAYHSHRQHRTRSARCQVARRPQGIERDIGESSAIRESPAQQVASR